MACTIPQHLTVIEPSLRFNYTCTFHIISVLNSWCSSLRYLEQKVPCFSPSVKKKKKDHLTIWKCCRPNVSLLFSKSLPRYSSPSTTLNILTSFPLKNSCELLPTLSESRKYFLLNLKPVIVRLFPTVRKDTQDGFPSVIP